MQNSLNEALRRTTKVDNYNRWIYEIIEKELGGRIMEIGCGIGNLTSFFWDREFVLATDIEPSFLNEIAQKTKDKGNMVILEYDVGTEDPEQFKQFQIDTVVCLNVLEHVQDDQRALDNIFQILSEGGTLIILVPVLQFLYGSLDRLLGHKRRYSSKMLLSKLRKAGFNVRSRMYMNAIGIPGWFLNSKILRKEIVPNGQLSLYNKLVPFIKFVENIIYPPIGLSLICFCTKPYKNNYILAREKK